MIGSSSSASGLKAPSTDSTRAQVSSAFRLPIQSRNSAGIDCCQSAAVSRGSVAGAGSCGAGLSGATGSGGSSGSLARPGQSASEAAASCPISCFVTSLRTKFKEAANSVSPVMLETDVRRLAPPEGEGGGVDATVLPEEDGDPSPDSGGGPSLLPSAPSRGAGEPSMLPSVPSRGGGGGEEPSTLPSVPSRASTPPPRADPPLSRLSAPTTSLASSSASSLGLPLAPPTTAPEFASLVTSVGSRPSSFLPLPSLLSTPTIAHRFRSFRRLRSALPRCAAVAASTPRHGFCASGRSRSRPSSFATDCSSADEGST
mmetsp:Transcript_20855/g.67067  ORF Transcript_20855/g.67067 Transcript_20855/m.67067 type:complete len:315 (+) Transcript_20855:687-1631(+)